MKKIAFIMNSIMVGGAEISLINLLNKIDFERYDVTLWLKNPSETVNRIDPHVKIKYRTTLSTKALLLTYLKKRQYCEALKAFYYRVLSKIFTAQWEKNLYYNECSYPKIEETYDCVIAYQALNIPGVIFALNRVSANKKVLWVHGSQGWEPKFYKFWDNLYIKFDVIFCVSKLLQQEFMNNFPNAGVNTRAFYNLVDPELLKQKSREQQYKLSHPGCRLVTVGRLSQEKGQLLIPQTARLLLDGGYAIKWYLVGDGSLRPALEQEIERLGVQEQVILLGTKDNPYPYMKACDIYVQTSYSEGFGLTVAEAKILHKPIVTTDAGVMSEQISIGENGLIVPEATSQALYEGIKMLLDHPELREKFVRNLENEKYDTSKEMQKLYDFIESD